MSSTSLEFLLTATDHASPKFNKLGGNVDKARAHLAAFGKIAAVAIAAAGVASVKLAADFQETTTQLVTGAGESAKNLEMMKQGVLALAPAVGVGPNELAKGLYFVESAGYRGAKGLDVLRAAAEGAKIGGADMTVVADGLTTALTDYHLPASKAAEVTSKLIATVTYGKTTIGDLAGSLSDVLPFAASFGIGLDDISGAMATMTAQGIKADQASTMLKFTMMSMANETPQGVAALKSVGLSAAQVHDAMGTKGLSGAMAMVTDAIGKKFPAGSTEATAALSDIMGGTRGMGAALALTGPNMETYTQNIKNIGAAATETGGHVKGWALTQEDLKTKLAQAQAALEVIAVKIGTKLIPILTQVATYFSEHVIPALMEFGRWVKQNKDWLVPLVVVIGTFVAIIKAAQIAMGIATVAQWAWKTALVDTGLATKIATAAQWAWDAALSANPIGIIIVAIAALVGAIIWLATQTTFFQGSWKSAMKVIGFAIKWVWEKEIKPVGDFIAAMFTNVGNVVSSVFNGVVWYIKTAINNIINLINGAMGGINFLIRGINSIPGVSIPTIPKIPHLATGGFITQGGMAVVGERGPELVSLPTGSRVHPNGSGGSTEAHFSDAQIDRLIAGIITASRNTANGAIDNLGREVRDMKRKGVFA